MIINNLFSVIKYNIYCITPKDINTKLTNNIVQMINIPVQNINFTEYKQYDKYLLNIKDKISNNFNELFNIKYFLNKDFFQENAIKDLLIILLNQDILSIISSNNNEFMKFISNLEQDLSAEFKKQNFKYITIKQLNKEQYIWLLKYSILDRYRNYFLKYQKQLTSILYIIIDEIKKSYYKDCQQGNHQQINQTLLINLDNQEIKYIPNESKNLLFMTETSKSTTRHKYQSYEYLKKTPNITDQYKKYISSDIINILQSDNTQILSDTIYDNKFTQIEHKSLIHMIKLIIFSPICILICVNGFILFYSLRNNKKTTKQKKIITIANNINH